MKVEVYIRILAIYIQTYTAVSCTCLASTCLQGISSAIQYNNGIFMQKQQIAFYTKLNAC